MAHNPQRYGAITSLDLLKQNNGQSGLRHGLKRHQGQCDTAMPNRLHHPTITGHTENLSIHANPKHPRLDLEDSIEASKIKRDTE